MMKKNIKPLNPRISNTCEFAIGLAGSYDDHSIYYQESYSLYAKEYPNTIVFPIFIGNMPEDLSEEDVKDIFHFNSFDINPSYLQYMFSNFKMPVVFTKVNTKPGKIRLSKELITTSVNLAYSRKYIYSRTENTLSWINNKEVLDIAIIDGSKKFGLSELPINIIKTPNLMKLADSQVTKGSSPEKFHLKVLAEKIINAGHFFERI